MRDMFPEYYFKPDEKKMWENAVFVPDTNVLLDVFHFSPETSKDLVKVLRHLRNQERLWIPYQFAHEYLRNVPSVYRKINDEYKLKKKALNKLCDAILQQLNDFDSLTDYELGERIDEIKTIFSVIKQGLEKFRKKHRERLENEDLEGQIASLFEGRIGCPFSEKRLAKTFVDGDRRYKLGIPPGFKDRDKEESRKYGDLVGWLQTIRYAQKQKPKHPIIMITNDSSGDDWFYKPKQDGKVKGPRPELIKEMSDKAEVGFYLYLTGEFMKKANEYLKLDEPVSEPAINEARSSGRRRTASLTPIDYFFKDTAASAAAIQASIIPNIADLTMYDAAMKARAAENARLIDAMTRPTVDAANAYFKGIADQAFKNLSYDTSLFFGTGTSRRRAPIRDEEEDWDEELGDDEKENGDLNDDDNSDDPDTDPAPVEG